MVTDIQTNLKRSSLTQRFFVGQQMLKGICCVLLGLIFSSPAMGQFVVQPMKLSLSLRGGQVVKKEILLQNYGGDDNRPVTLEVVDLSQNATGDWVTPTDSMDTTDVQDAFPGVSCRSWLKLSRTNIELNGKSSKAVEVEIRVPPGVRGFYCAAIQAIVAPRDSMSRVSIKYELVVPVLIEIEGIPLKHRLSLDDVEVKPFEGKDSLKSTQLVFSISNTGETMANVSGKGWVKYWDDKRKRWKPVVSELNVIEERTVIPGVKAQYRQDIGVDLPSGRYQVLGMLNVDNRESGVFEKEFDYVGRVGVELVEEAAIRCASDFILIDDARVKRTCRGSVELRNYSFHPVTVHAKAAVPKEMAGKIWYGRKGDDMSCADWIKVQPEEIILQPFGSRNVRVVGKIPEDASYRSKGYYADLTFEAEYKEEKTDAGSVTVQVAILDQEVKQDLKIKGHSLKLGQLDDTGERFIVEATYGNRSDVHVIPEVRVRLLEKASQQAYKMWTLVNRIKEGPLLPYENRSFSKPIVLSNVPEGDYELVSEFVSGGEVVESIKKPLKIYSEGGQRVIEIAANAPDQAEVGSEAPTYSW